MVMHSHYHGNWRRRDGSCGAIEPQHERRRRSDKLRLDATSCRMYLREPKAAPAHLAREAYERLAELSLAAEIAVGFKPGTVGRTHRAGAEDRV